MAASGDSDGLAVFARSAQHHSFVGGLRAWTMPCPRAERLWPVSNRAVVWGNDLQCTVTFNALYLGHASWNHLLLLAGILISFYYVRSLYVLLWITLFGLCLFVGVEGWYASGRQGFLEGDAALEPFLASVKNTSVYSLIALTIGFAYYNRALLNSTQQALDREAARSEALLLNILPRPIAERLKSSTQLIADRIPEVSIVFADLVGFTEMSRTHGRERPR